MDGNGRWASARGLPRTTGHLRGASVARRLIEWATENHLSALTLYTFSTENWARPSMEIDTIFRLVAKYIERNVGRLAHRNVNVRFIGTRHGLPRDLCDLMDRAQASTAACSGLKLNIAINYGGRDELVRICRQLARHAIKSGIDPDSIDETAISARSDLAHCSPPDLIVRTGGDRRLSNFLLWHVAYSELTFTDTLWPDFAQSELRQILSDFKRRDRRFGAVSRCGSEQASAEVLCPT